MTRSLLARMAATCTLAAPFTPGLMDYLPGHDAASAQSAVPTAFTYQGRLDFNSLPAEGQFDLRFRVHESQGGAGELASTTLNAVPVSGGLFTVVIDFGTATSAAFNNGTGRWLGIEVRPVGTSTWTVLPRQQLNSTPYAMRLEGISRDSAGRWGIGGINTGGDFTVRRPATAAIMVDSGTAGSSLEAAYRLADRGSVMWTIQKNVDNNLGFFRSSGTTPAMTVNHTNGFVGVGTAAPTAPLHVNGRIKTNVLEILGGSDIAEPFDIRDSGGPDGLAVQPGMLVSIDPANPGALRLTTSAYDRTVAGVISGAGGVNTGMILRQEGTEMADGKHPIAMTGRVWAFVDADAGGAIQPGDLLTTSDVPGHAMKVGDDARSHGAVIGKAMTSLSNGRGLVLVLVNLQ